MTLEGRVGWRLGEHKPRLGPDGGGRCVEVGGVHERDVDAEFGEKLVGEAVGTAVDDVADHDMIACFEEAEEDGHRCCHPGCVCRGVGAALKCGELFL